MTTLSLVLPYYRNPGMLAHQYGVWAAYPAAAKAALEVVLVDDGSPEPALAVPRQADLPLLRLFRVLEDRPWHQHGARNLGAHMAAGPWLLVTDIDHVVPAETLTGLLAFLPQADPQTAYTFFRVDAPHRVPTRNERGELKPHVNTFLLTRAHYWAVGGYDEDYVGYGTDSYFRRRLRAAGRIRHLEALAIERVPRTVIPDASSAVPGVDAKVLRNRGRRPAQNARTLVRKTRHHLPPTVLAFPWEAVPL